MALLDDFFSLTDEKLAATYATPQFDAEKARKPLLAAIEKASAQFGSVEPVRGRKAWSVNRGVVRFDLPIPIKGKSEVHAPSERFPDALAKLKAAIEAGELDADLEKQAESGEATPAPTRAASASTGEKKPRAGWTPERRAKMAEARKRKAAEAK